VEGFGAKALVTHRNENSAHVRFRRKREGAFAVLF